MHRAHNKRVVALRVLACALVVCLGLSPLSALAASYDASLDEVMDGNVPGLTVRVNGVGGYYGQCMAGDFINDTGQPLKIRVPVGLRLVPQNEGVQTMVTGGAETLTIPPGTSTQKFTAFCSEEHDGGPSGSKDFSNGGFVDPALMRVLDRIAAAEGQDSSAQHAVWSVTDGLDISGDPNAQNYADRPQVPAGPAAAGGLAAGAAAIGLAELSRRMAEIQGVDLPPEGDGTEGGEPGGSSDSGEDSTELDDLLDTDESGADDDAGSDDDAGDTPDGSDETEPPEKTEEKPPAKDIKKPPPPPAPLRAGEDGDIRWDKNRRRVLIGTDSGLNLQAGRGGGWVGRGGGPGHDPFELKPPGSVDVGEGDVTGHKRGDTYDLSIPTGDGKPSVNIYRNEQTDRTQLQRGHFVLSQQGSRVGMSDLLGGQRTGASYDGSSGDFEVFRNNFRLSRTGDSFRVGDKTPGGREVSATYNSQTGGARVDVGDRWLSHDGDTSAAGWGDRGLVYDGKKHFGAYQFPTNGGKGSLAVGGGSEGQFGIGRVQPLRIGNREARLNVDYSRMLRDSGGGTTTEMNVGLDVGRVSVNWSPGDRPSVRYNIKF